MLDPFTDDLVRRYRDGESCDAIAAATGLTLSAVCWWLRRAGAEMGSPIGGRGRRPLELPDAQIIERYRAGETALAIARSFGVSANTIRGRLIRAGIKRRGRGLREFSRLPEQNSRRDSA
jgi:hypothetical protein